MEEINAHNEQIDRIDANEATTIFGHPLKWYWSQIKMPIIFLILFELVISIVLLVLNIRNKIEDSFNVAMLPIEIVVFAIIGWRLIRKNDSTWHQALFAGTYAGFVLGFTMAVFKLIFIREQWTVFNLFTESIFSGIAGAIIAGTVGVLSIRRKSKT